MNIDESMIWLVWTENKNFKWDLLGTGLRGSVGGGPPCAGAGTVSASKAR